MKEPSEEILLQHLRSAQIRYQNLTFLVAALFATIIIVAVAVLLKTRDILGGHIVVLALAYTLELCLFSTYQQGVMRHRHLNLSFNPFFHADVDWTPFFAGILSVQEIIIAILGSVFVLTHGGGQLLATLLQGGRDSFPVVLQTRIDNLPVTLGELLLALAAYIVVRSGLFIFRAVTAALARNKARPSPNDHQKLDNMHRSLSSSLGFDPAHSDARP